jgi:hypothetical protein
VSDAFRQFRNVDRAFEGKIASIHCGISPTGPSGRSAGVVARLPRVCTTVFCSSAPTPAVQQRERAARTREDTGCKLLLLQFQVPRFLAVPRFGFDPSFSKITKEFLYFVLLEKKQLTRKPLIGFFYGSKDIGKTNFSTKYRARMGRKIKKKMGRELCVT